ncbi:MAG: hypothetical protein AAF944_02800 [Bacteroidota bacterium]
MSRLMVARHWAIVLHCLVSVACSSTKTISQNESISIHLNQKQVNIKKGFRLSRAKAASEPYLNLEVNDSVLVDNLAKSDNLQIILARGSRLITSFQTEYDIPYRLEFKTGSLFSQAKIGDRLIFYAQDFVLCTLPIIR